MSFWLFVTRHFLHYFAGVGQEQDRDVQVLLQSKLVAVICIANYRWCRCFFLSVCSSLILRYRVFVSGLLLLCPWGSIGCSYCWPNTYF